ncbi:helix-turn-helix transcriptional regulator [Kribbella antibiotica]|uniref:helix-turn-helix transcriptional regulator n=1 Tax=Kribbella antibiotica TaxID=190195 RepID=UPI001404A1FA|nr:response regulator transcription factor [Kribbella antibiotica]
MKRPTTVAVHASDPVTARGADHLLHADARLTVLAEGDDLCDAAVLVVIGESVTDRALSFLSRARATSRLESPPRCVIVSDQLQLDGLAVLQYGVAAVLPRSRTSGEKLVQTVLAVSRGAAYLPAWLQGDLLAQFDRLQRDVLEPNGLTLSGLSARERDILRLVAEGDSTEEIAVKLEYSERTVKNVLQLLMRRHRLKNRAHAVAFAWRTGVLG